MAITPRPKFSPTTAFEADTVPVNVPGPSAALAQVSGQLADRFGNIANAQKEIEARDQADIIQAQRYRLAAQLAEARGQFETEFNRRLPEMDPTDTEFGTRAREEWDATARSILEQYPEEVSLQYEPQVIATGYGFNEQAAAFARESRKDIYRLGVETEVNSYVARVTAQPDDYYDLLEDTMTIIEQTNLPFAEKQQLLYKATQRLQEGVLSGLVQANGASRDLGVSLGAANGLSVVEQLIINEEGFRAQPYWDVNRLRAGFGSDTVTRPDGSFVDVDETTVVSEADAYRDLQRRIVEFGTRAQKQMGAAWDQLPESARAAIISVTYNYGHVPDPVIAAGADLTKLANAVASLKSNPERRKREAMLILGDHTVAGMLLAESDPRLSLIPIEQRQAAMADAERAREARDSAALAARKEADTFAYESFVEEIVSGRMTEETLTKTLLAKEGWAADPGRRSAVIAKWAAADKEQREIRQAVQYVRDGGTFILGNADHKKMYGQFVSAVGIPARVAAMEPEAVDEIISVANQVGHLEDGLLDQMRTLSLSQNPKAVEYALGFFAKFEETNPRMYVAQVPENLRSQIEFLRTNQDTITPEEQNERLQLAGNPAGRAEAAKIRDAVTTIINDTNQNYGPADAASSLDFEYENFTTFSRERFAQDYTEEFTRQFTLYQNADKAKAATIKAMQGRWGETAAGGRVMKYPPELMGYKPINGSYDWMQYAIASEIPGLGTSYMLRGDGQTVSESQAYVKGQGKNPPSYLVYDIDDEGRIRQLYKDGQPMRYFFEPRLEDRQAEVQSFKKQSMLAELNALSQEYMVTKLQALSTLGSNILTGNKEYGTKLRQLEQEIKQLQEKYNQAFPPIPVQPDLQGGF